MDLKSTAYSVADRVATISLNRPHRMNAWTGRMHAEYRYLLGKADRDRHVSVIVVTGVGRAFCAGADFQALEGHLEKGEYDPGTGSDLETPGRRDEGRFGENFTYHFALQKPVIAAINGAAAGVGLVLACYADLRFAAAGVKLTTAHGRFNMPAEYGLSWLLPRLVGLTRANDLLLSSRVFLSEEAADMGLINKVLPGERLMGHVYEYARGLIASVSPGSLARTKRQIYVDQHRDVDESVREADRLLDQMVREPNYRAGVKAFLEKTPADWDFNQ